MAISVQTLIKERKYRFIFSLLALILITVLLLLTKTQSPVITSTLDLPAQSPPQSTSSSPLAPAPPLLQDPPISSPNSTVSTPPPVHHDQLSWNLCDGAVAVDYIPCLDNFKAIKALKSRRHMERKERHCPVPSPRCLVPLPVGYRVPVPWPKSRDMVR